MPKDLSLYKCSKCKEYYGRELFNLELGLCFGCADDGETDTTYRWSEDSDFVIEDEENG